MRSIEVVRYQQRLDNLFSKAGTLSTDIEVQAHWARYLCVLVSGFIEMAVRETYSQYARNKAAPYVANFVDGRLRGFQNPNMERILQLTRLFSPQWEEHLRNSIEGEPKDAIDSIVANRNRIAHGEDVGITYVRIKSYYESAIKVVEVIEEQCST